MKSEYEIWRDELNRVRKPRAARSSWALVLVAIGAVLFFLWADALTRTIQAQYIDNAVNVRIQ